MYGEAEDCEFISVAATAKRTIEADLLKTFVLKDTSSLIPLKKVKVYDIGK